MTRLPELHVWLGLVFFGLGVVAKEKLPLAVGSLPIIQLPCAYFSAVMIPFGSLLALHALILQNRSRRSLLSYHLVGIIFGLMILSQYFAVSFMSSRVMDSVQFPSILPKLAENARNLPGGQRRALQARWAYRWYGVILAYRLDNQQAVYFEPDADDLAARRAEVQSTSVLDAQRAVIKKLIAQYPYLFSLYAATYTTTFVAGWAWLALKIPRETKRTLS